jgi:hypothetical protein
MEDIGLKKILIILPIMLAKDLLRQRREHDLHGQLENGLPSIICILLFPSILIKITSI